MAEVVPTESKAAGQIHPFLRQRMLNRAATFSEGAQPMQPVPMKRRRSSIFSEYSDARSLRTSVNDINRLTSTDDEPTYWYSAPLAFAILPAVGGLLFKNGSAVVTDVLLLALGSMFLNWCVRAPWYAYSYILLLRAC
jgi:hypothetical protein